jgi:gamma-glutamylcyclotransferase (GGCT)/AIG2-like uncharacterized protein YtfP
MPKRKPDEEKLVARCYMIPPQTLKQIDEIAKAKDWGKALVVREALEIGLAALQKGIPQCKP